MIDENANQAPAETQSADTDAPQAATVEPQTPPSPPTAEDAIAAAVGLGGEEQQKPDVEPKEGESAKAKTKPEADAAAEAKPETKPETKADAKQDDVYTPPEGLSERAKARFAELASRAKEGEVWKERAEQWQQTIASTGASPEQFGQLLTYTSLVNSGDPEKLRQAMNVLERERNAIARMIGEEAPGIDLLSDHPDLIQRVQQGDFDRHAALEVARARTLAAQQRQRDEWAQIQQMQSATQTQAIQSLNTLGQQLEAQDPQYRQKFAQLQPMLPIIAQLPPERWGEAFMQAYQSIVVPAPTPVPQQQRLPAAPQPLRGTGGGGTALQQQATSAQQAIEQALGLG